MFVSLNFANRKAIAYIRKSTNDANRQKYSIQSQKEQIEKWCDQMGVILIRTFKDDHSAKDFNRPGWNQLTAYLNQNKKQQLADLLLVVDYSRFSRDEVLGYVSINQLESFNIELQAIDQLLDSSVPESKIMRGLNMTMPAVDNAWRSIKVKRGMTLALKQGNWVAPVPMGYWKDKNEGKITATKEGRLIGMAMQMVKNGSSITDAHMELHLRGLNITFKRFSKMLRNPFYAGLISHKLLEDEIVKGNHKGVISESDFEELQRVLSNNRKDTHKHLDLYPLKGFIQCPNCQTYYTGYQVKKKQKPNGDYRLKQSKPIYYKCKCANVSGKKAHKQFSTVLDSLSLNEDYLAAFKDMAISVIQRISLDDRQRIVLINREIGQVEAKIERLEERYLYERVIDTKTYEKHSKKLFQRLDDLRESKKSSGALSNPTDFVNFVCKNISNIDIKWNESTFKRKRGLQRWMFPEGFFYDKHTEQYLTPRLNSIFNLTRSFSNGITKKPTHSDRFVNFGSPPLTIGLTPLSNPKGIDQLTFIEDIIAFEEFFKSTKF